MKIKLCALIALALPVFAQTGIKAALAKHWKVSGDLTIAVAKAMPAESYNFRPNPEEMNFGQLMAHIALANVAACSRASGMPRPEVPDKIMAWNKDPNKIDIDRDTGDPVPDRYVQLLLVGGEQHEPGNSQRHGGPRRPADERVRSALVLLHAHRPPSRAGRSLPARQGHQAAGLRVLGSDILLPADTELYYKLTSTALSGASLQTACTQQRISA